MMRTWTLAFLAVVALAVAIGAAGVEGVGHWTARFLFALAVLGALLAAVRHAALQMAGLPANPRDARLAPAPHRVGRRAGERDAAGLVRRVPRQCAPECIDG